MVEEVARHRGHVDILREVIDTGDFDDLIEDAMHDRAAKVLRRVRGEAE